MSTTRADNEEQGRASQHAAGDGDQDQAGPPRVEDKHGRAINQGDVVEFVYGGVHHRMRVERVEHERESLRANLSGSIAVHVHAAACTKVRERGEEAMGRVESAAGVRGTPGPRRDTAGPAADPATNSSAKGDA